MTSDQELNEIRPAGNEAARPLAVLLAFIELRNPEPLRRVIASLREHLPAAMIVALRTPATQAVEALLPEVDRWVTVPGGASLDFAHLADLRRSQPAAVCLIYQTPEPRAHLKLELMAARIGAKRLLQALPAEQGDRVALLPLSRTALWLRIAGKSCHAVALSLLAGLLAVAAGVVLSATDLLVRPGERLGEPEVGERR